MTLYGRGAQVRLMGEARLAARGRAGAWLTDNMRRKAVLEESGDTAPGDRADGSTVTGRAALEEVFAPGGQVSGLLGLVNVLDYGASLDGATDDTAAFQAALDALPAAGGCLTIPAGLALLSAPLTASGKGVTIRGAGSGATELRWTAAGGIALSGSSVAHRFVVEGLYLSSAVMNSNAALSISYPSSAGLSAQQCFLSDVQAHFHNLGGWAGGILLHNARNSAVHGCLVRGPFSLAQAYGFRVSGEATDCKFTGCQVISAATGWDIIDQAEGTILDACVVVKALVGVSKSHAGGEPWLAMAHCHVNAIEKAVYLNNVLQSFVSDCLLYAFTDATMTAWTGVDLAGTCRDIMLSNTTFHGSGFTGTKTGVLVGGSVSRVDILGCRFLDVNTARSYASGSSNVQALGCSYSGVTTRESDAGTNNRTMELNSSSMFGVSNGGNGYFEIAGGSAAWLRLVDQGGAANNKIVSLLGDSGVLSVRQLNDDNSTRATLCRLDAGALSLGGDLGAEALRLVPVASAVNRLDGRGAVTGAAPKLAAAGSDTDISLELQSKGAGVVRLMMAAGERLRVDGDATNAVLIWANGGMKRIEVGAADSGGTGYRALRVTN